MMHALLKSILKKAAYVTAVLVIFAALAMSAVRLLTPILDEHRADFEKWTSNLLNMPVTIGNVRVSWYQYQPVIKLNQVTLLNKDTKEPILQIQKVRVLFSLPQSLWQWRLVPSGVMIAGTDVHIHQTANGEIAVQGFPSLNGFAGQPYQRETKFTDIALWLSLQPRLTLQNVDIRYTSATGQEKYVTLYNLNFRNTDIEHEIFGKAILHQEISTEVTLAIKWTGNNIDLSKIKAKIYLYVSGLSLLQWLKDSAWNGWQINQGIVSAKIWATWDNGAFSKIQSMFQLYGLNLYSATDQSTHLINRLSGNFGWRREGDQQIFAGDEILIDLPKHFWPVTSFYVSLAPDAAKNLTLKRVNLGYVDLNDIQPFLFSSPPFLPPAVKQVFTDLQLKGDIQNAVLVFHGAATDWQNVFCKANFSQLSVAPWHQFPGVQHLAGSLQWNGKQGDLILNSNQAVFQFASLFKQPLTMEQLTGNMTWQRDAQQNWLLQISSLHAMTSDAAAEAKGLLTIPPDLSPSIDLSANFTLQKANHVSHYLPLRLFDPELIEWLQEAFLSGEVQSGHAILRGKLSDFPFDDHKGQFIISAVAKNVYFRYAPNWPLLEKLSGNVTFSGRKMQADVDYAEMLGVPVKQVHGDIPFIGDTEPLIVNVQTGNMSVDFTDAMRVVHSSPLKKTIGKLFTGMELHGPLQLKLGLTIPAKNPDDTKVLGDITLQNTRLSLVPWHVVLNNVNGQVHFTENTTTAKQIHAELFNKPLLIDLATLQKTKDLSIVQASLAGNLSVVDLETWLKVPFSRVLQGNADLKGQIDFSLTTPVVVHLQSDLVGLAVNLSPPYAKKAEEPRAFSTDIFIADNQPLKMQLNYGGIISAALMLNHENDQFKITSLNLGIGKNQAPWPQTPGLYISGNLDRLNGDDIKKYAATTPDLDFMKTLPLRGIDIRTKNLDLFGQQITDARLQATPDQSRWNVIISSKSVSGNIGLPMKLTSQGLITAHFEQLYLRSKSSTRTEKTVLDIQSLPAISFSADRVRYNDMSLGQVSFKTSPTTNGLTIESLSMTTSHSRLQANGNWTQSGNHDTTHLQGNATSNNVSEFLTELGFNAHNFIASDGRFSFNVNWNSAPYTFSLASLNGNANVKIGRGRIVDVGEADAEMGLGRMLNIFSLQTIPRRLSFDFSDVFQKGYSFDLLAGDLNLKNGNVYTSNTHFDGPVARIDIAGRIGLDRKDYDLQLSVTPYVTSSIPLAATVLTGNPLIGLAALGMNTVIGAAKVITYYYTVRGPWSNPRWESVKVFQRK